MNLYVLRTWIRARWARDERGASLIEYVLLVSLIAMAVIGAITFLGSQLSPRFNNAGSQLSSAPGP